MKIYIVFFYNGEGNISYVLMGARNERRARNEFNRDYGRRKIIAIEESIL